MKGCKVVSIINNTIHSYNSQGGNDRTSSNTAYWNGVYFNVLKEDFITVFGEGSAGSNNAGPSSGWGSDAVLTAYRYRINNDRTITKTGDKFGQVTLKASGNGNHLSDWGGQPGATQIYKIWF